MPGDIAKRHNLAWLCQVVSFPEDVGGGGLAAKEDLRLTSVAVAHVPQSLGPGHLKGFGRTLVCWPGRHTVNVL